jgi:hypothetical protein
MHAAIQAMVIAATLPLLSLQDVPLRGPGQFTATSSGIVTGQIAGDASATVFRNRMRELYLQLNSDQMMKLKTMIAVTVTLPVGAGTFPLDGRSAQASVSWERMATHARQVVPATGSITVTGTDLLSGRFTLSATSGTEKLTLTGSFEKAPVLPALD